MQLNLTGVRVEKSEVYNGKTFTVVAAPAPDAFSHPSKFRVSSNGQIGRVGELIDLSLVVSGVVKPKSFFDKSSGQQKFFDESSVYLEVQNYKQHVPAAPVK